MPGKLDTANAAYVISTLQTAVDGCQNQTWDAMVTAPVQKSIINEAGIPFSGHTEFLAEATGTARVVMMLVAKALRVALATTHLPLKDVPGAVNTTLLIETLKILNADLISRFKISRPLIAVLGLNPHAGEDGYLGREEIDTIIPALDTLRSAGMHLDGPLPADTAFKPQTLERYDAVLAMYHDQGLPVLKHVGFGEAINITLGLPITRISVDHGTALDLAATGQANYSSMVQALRQAIEVST